MVLFGLYTGSKVELGGREFRIIQYDSVLGVLIPEGDTPDEEK
jgi:co-chaperonin GroES (HSP10)